MATGHVTQGARLARGGLSFAIAEQTAFWLVIALMLFLGVTMMIIAAWVYRSNDPEPEVLAPLDLMGKSKFREADSESQQRQLDEARPPGATTLRSAVSVSRSRRRPAVASQAKAASASAGEPVDEDDLIDGVASEDDALSDDAIGDRRVDDGDPVGDDGAPTKRRRPRRYLAGDGPARRRPGAERFDGPDLDSDLADDDRSDDADVDDYDVDEDYGAYAPGGDEHIDDGVDDDIDDYEDGYGAEYDRDMTYYGDDAFRPGVSAQDDVDDDDDELDPDDLESDVDDDDSDPDEQTEDGGDDAQPVHRRSRLPFRVFGATADDLVADVDDDDVDLGVDADEALDDERYDDRYLDDLDEDVLDVDLAPGAVLVEVDDDPESADGDTWLDRAEREDPSSGFRRQRASGGGRWRRRPVPAGETEIVDYDEVDDLDGVDDSDDADAFEEIDVSIEQNGVDIGPALHSDTLTDQEEVSNDMDFEHDDFDAYGDRANRPGAAADPFFEDDFDGEWNESTSPGRPRRRARRAAEAGTPTETPSPRRVPSAGMSSFDPDEMVDRFRERAAAVRRRPLPPVAGQERQEFIQQAKIDYQDFAMIGDAEVSIEDGVLVLRVDLRG